MRKVFAVVGIIVGVVALGALVGWFASRGPSVPPLPPQSAPEAANPTVVTQQPVASVEPAPHPQPHPEPKIAAVPPPVQTQAVAQVQTSTNSNALTNWEDTVDNIIGSDGDDTNKVKQLFALFPNLPPDGQEEVAQHLSNLVDDENYAPLGELLKNGKLPEGALDQLLSDALNRPNTLKLPLLVDVAQDPNHPKAAEAKDLLELYLGEDYGNDWSAWRQHMKDWLKDNPE